jgi:outer membrane murein-binding lipoprotein Lpp
MADYSQSLRDDDAEGKRRGGSPNVVPLYVISFAVLVGAVIGFIVLGTNLSSKSTSITTLNAQIANLTTLVNSLNASVAAAQASVQAVNTSANTNIKNLNTSVNTQFTTFNKSVGNISNGVQILYGNVSTLAANATALQTLINGLSTPVSIPLNVTAINSNGTTTINITNATTFAVTSSPLSGITTNGYVSCSAVVAFNSSVAGPTFNLGYVVGNGNFTSLFTSVVSNSSNNVGFANLIVGVNPSLNNKTLSFQWAFTATADTILNITNVATTASCSWFA